MPQYSSYQSGTLQESSAGKEHVNPFNMTNTDSMLMNTAEKPLLNLEIHIDADYSVPLLIYKGKEPVD